MFLFPLDYSVVSASVSYFEAWGQWFGGRQVDPDARLWWMSVRWWARAAKIGTFVGGATVVLDLIGAERLRAFARDPELSRRFNSRVIRFAVGVLAFALVFVGGWDFFIGIVTVAMEGLKKFGAPVAIWLLDNERPAQVLRYAGLFLLLVGFHFDLLAS